MRTDRAASCLLRRSGEPFRVHIFPLRRFHEIIFIIPEMLGEQPPQESMPVFVFAVTPDRLRTGILQPFSKAVWQVSNHIGYLETQ
jgi:hypothetical protein